MAPGKSGVASSATAMRIGCMSEIPVELNEEGVGGGRIRRGAADQIGAHVQVRDDEPGDSSPPAEAGSASGGRTETLGSRDEVYAAQYLEIGLKPPGMAGLHAGVAEGAREESVDLRGEDQRRPGHDARRQPV